MLGCTSPAAENYNPAATEDDGSCIFLNKIEGVCYEFGDPEPDKTVDHSFTVSMVLDDETLQPVSWGWYHDYFPDMYVHTRQKLLNLKNNMGFHHNEGVRGRYHSNEVKPFYIDILFSDKSSMILNSVNWVTEVRKGGNDETDDNEPALYNETVTAITIWNNYQTTGRISLDKGVEGLSSSNNRNNELLWNFNKFRNLVEVLDEQFISDIFNDYKVDPTKLNTDLPWFEKRLMQGNYFIVRFEFNNSNDKQITIHEVDADVSKSYR